MNKFFFLSVTVGYYVKICPNTIREECETCSKCEDYQEHGQFHRRFARKAMCQCPRCEMSKLLSIPWLITTHRREHANRRPVMNLLQQCSCVRQNLPNSIVACAFFLFFSSPAREEKTGTIGGYYISVVICSPYY